MAIIKLQKLFVSIKWLFYILNLLLAKVISNAAASLLIANNCNSGVILNNYYTRKLHNIKKILDGIGAEKESLLNTDKHRIFASNLYEAIDVSVNVLMKAHTTLNDLNSRYICSNAFETSSKFYSKNTPPSKLFSYARPGFVNEVFSTEINKYIHNNNPNENDSYISQFLEKVVDIFKRNFLSILITLSPKDFISFVKKAHNEYFDPSHFNSLLSNNQSEASEKVRQLTNIIRF